MRSATRRMACSRSCAPAFPTTLPAARASRAIRSTILESSAVVTRSSSWLLCPRSQNHEVVSVNDLIKIFITQDPLDVRRPSPPDPLHLVRGITGQPAGELGPRRVEDADRIAHREPPP